MKAILLLTALALAVSVPTAPGADMSKIPLIGGLFKKKPDTDTDEIHQTDPSKATDGYDLGNYAPTLIRKVPLSVDPKYTGTQFELTFIVDTRGRPTNIRPTSPGVDPELLLQVIDAVRAWRFSPARDAYGNPVERAVILPVNVVAPDQRR